MCSSKSQYFLVRSDLFYKGITKSFPEDLNVMVKLEQDPSMPNSAFHFVWIRFSFQSGIISPSTQVFIPKQRDWTPLRIN